MGCFPSKRTVVVQCTGFENDAFQDTYHLGRMLGTGAYGRVFLANRTDSDEELAVKVLTLADPRRASDGGVAIQDFRREQRIWAHAGQHPNIVSLVESHMKYQFGYFAMEYCQDSLLQAWRSEPELNEYTYAKYFTDMAIALQHIHSLGIVHRDIKHDNCLVGGRAGRTVKLCDFGLARMLHDSSALAKPCGSAPYIAPEVLKPHVTSGTASDVWSLGVIVYVCFFGQWPYQPKQMTRKAFREAIRSGDEKPSFKPSRRVEQGTVSDVAIEFVQAMLERDPTARRSATDCLKMEYLRRQNIRTAEADGTSTSQVSLLQVLQRAIRFGAFTDFDSRRAAEMASTFTFMEEQGGAHTVSAASRCQQEESSSQATHSPKKATDVDDDKHSASESELQRARSDKVWLDAITFDCAQSFGVHPCATR